MAAPDAQSLVETFKTNGTLAGHACDTGQVWSGSTAVSVANGVAYPTDFTSPVCSIGQLSTQLYDLELSILVAPKDLQTPCAPFVTVGGYTIGDFDSYTTTHGDNALAATWGGVSIPYQDSRLSPGLHKLRVSIAKGGVATYYWDDVSISVVQFARPAYNSADKISVKFNNNDGRYLYGTHFTLFTGMRIISPAPGFLWKNNVLCPET
jgi:hypothetical protein